MGSDRAGHRIRPGPSQTGRSSCSDLRLNRRHPTWAAHPQPKHQAHPPQLIATAGGAPPMSFKHRMMRRGNAIGVWIHRRFKGRLDSGSKDVHVLMMTSPGRRTGKPRATMVRYLDDESSYLVWGTGSGSRTEPDWFRNLRKTPGATIEIGTTTQQVRGGILDDAERDRVWNEVVLTQVPAIAKYAQKAGRTIPIARLTPSTPSESPWSRRHGRLLVKTCGQDEVRQPGGSRRNVLSRAAPGPVSGWRHAPRRSAGSGRGLRAVDASGSCRSRR